jgi:hypothetical protein
MGILMRVTSYFMGKTINFLSTNVLCAFIVFVAKFPDSLQPNQF